MRDHGQFRQPDRAPESGQSERSPFWSVRSVAIIFIALIATGFGFYFKSHASPGAAPADFSRYSSQYIDVYESVPVDSVTMAVTLGQGFLNPNYGRYDTLVGLRPRGYTYFHERVDISLTAAQPSASVTMMITSNIKPVTGKGEPGVATLNLGPVLPFKGMRSDGDKATARAERFAMQVSLSGSGRYWSGSVFFDAVPVIYQENGSVFGHLPSVGAHDVLYPPTDCLYVGYDRKTGQVKDVGSSFFSPPLPAVERIQSFGCPNHISSTEVFQNIVPALRNDVIDYANPAVDTVNDSDYTWHSAGCCGMEPAFKETSPESVDSQNKASFYAGIAFGVAGSAAIAIVQEVPVTRKRKRLTTGALAQQSDA
jgi:hypothetical protein